jgi:hypothetical protein
MRIICFAPNNKLCSIQLQNSLMWKDQSAMQLALGDKTNDLSPKEWQDK